MKTFSTLYRPLPKGFTLVEILTVIAVIVVLMGMSIGIGSWALLNTKIEKTRVQVKLFENKIQEYEADNGEFPRGDGSDRSSVTLYQALYEDGIRNDTKVYMPELDPEASDQFKRKIKDGLIMDTFKHKKAFFYLRAVDENGEQQGDAYNPDFDIWSLGPNGRGRNDSGNSDEDFDDDIHNW